MSFLLDALRKSELERRVGEVPRLTPGLPTGSRSDQPKRHPFIILVLVLVLINVGTLAYITALDRAGPVDAKENRSSSVPPRSMPGSAERTGPDTFSDNSATIETPGQPDPTARPLASVNAPSAVTLADIAPAGQSSTVHPISGLAPNAKAPPDIPQNRVNRSAEKPVPAHQPVLTKPTPTSGRPGQPDENLPRGVPSEPIQLTKVASPPANPGELKAPEIALQPLAKRAAILEAPVNTPADDTSAAIPLLGGLPRDFQREVPSLNINVFVYSEVPEERFVIINMTKYLAGQKIDSGPQILEIRPDSLVLEYLGRKFKIKRP
ncbi:MAG: general secretion pathway protein GspB [Methylococcaceae bacterium]|nr:general secretion pathway protein GspB [Methylococcaceae bacterium]